MPVAQTTIFCNFLVECCCLQFWRYPPLANRSLVWEQTPTEQGGYCFPQVSLYHIGLRVHGCHCVTCFSQHETAAEIVCGLMHAGHLQLGWNMHRLKSTNTQDFSRSLKWASATVWSSRDKPVATHKWTGQHGEFLIDIVAICLNLEIEKPYRLFVISTVVGD